MKLRAAAFIAILFLFSVLCQVDRILPFILAEAIKKDLALSDTQIGLMTGIAFAVCYTLLSLPLARAADRGSPRLVLVSCILVWSMMTAMGGLAGSFGLLAATRFGVALGEAGAIPSAHALIARRIGPRRRGMAIAIFSMGIPVGTMVGFAAGGAMADSVGWRVALLGAGATGGLLACFAWPIIGPTPPLAPAAASTEPALQTSRRLLAIPAFRWLMLGGVALGFASASFYAFTAPFLMRTHGYSASEVGLSFGLLQGAMGIVGTLAGGRLFDRAVQAGSNRLLGPPSVILIVAGATTTAALFASTGLLSVALFVPGMLSFAFLLPGAFGAAHLVAGAGHQATASSMLLIASGLFGPALAPLFVGMMSDWAYANDIPNGLGLGLLIAPVASVLAGLAMRVADQRIGQDIATSLPRSDQGRPRPSV
ncbi:MFS transporter [Sphingobium sp. BYY-5]|uniref:MFS transporter n=1 Tax=Sphingobium sp. BYY-5 TaxID=2926400 RepID=UPI001FA7180D|nr:MFS transporter [Sphingobium sp. BYY-5]MCI4592179.1 MFS transporter [Sphingobium sp. BYY-5]